MKPTGCYDRVPSPPREAIQIMGDLVRCGGKLNIEAVNRMKLMEAEILNWRRLAEKLETEKQIRLIDELYL